MKPVKRIPPSAYFMTQRMKFINGQYRPQAVALPLFDANTLSSLTESEAADLLGYTNNAQLLELFEV